MRAIKSWWLIVAFLSGFALAMWPRSLILNWRDNRLEFSAPRVHFLRGKPLELLHNAAPVPFDFQVTLWSGNARSCLRAQRRPFRGQLRPVGGKVPRGRRRNRRSRTGASI